MPAAPHVDSRSNEVSLPLIDVGSLVSGRGDALATARQIDTACRDTGFFRIVGHGVDPQLARDVDRLARAFFALPDHEKASVAMARGGRAWRGWFPLGGELTSGTPDRKEGWYAGIDHAADHPRVVAGAPLAFDESLAVAQRG